MKRLSIFLLVAGIALNLQAQEKQEGIVFMENEPWEAVLAKARKEDKLIFMDCYTTWCGPCKALSNDIFPQQAVGDFFNARFINVKYDMEKGDGKMLYDKYKIHIPGFPTLLLINYNGEVVHQMAGYMSADKLIDGMRAGLEGKSLFALAKRYDSGQRDFETIVAYVDALDAAVQEERKKEVVNEFIATMDNYSELEKPEVWNLVGSSIRNPYLPVFRYVVEHIDKSLPHRAGIDRYKLESQLNRAMSSAIREIITTSEKTENEDTLRMMRENAEYLKSLLILNTIKRFPDYMAKLQMFELMRDEKPMRLYLELAILRKTGLLRFETYFLSECYSWLIDRIDDRKIVQSSLDELLELQGPPKEKPSPLGANFYDKIARAYEKLGNQPEAAKAWEEHKRRNEITKEYMRRNFPDFVKDDE